MCTFYVSLYNIMKFLKTSSILFYALSTAPPTIIADSVNVVAIEGNMVTLICNATGDPVPDQTWSRNGNELMSSGRYQISADGRVLTVRGVIEAQDEGVFTCHASSMAGNDSATVTLSVQGTPRVYSVI